MSNQTESEKLRKLISDRFDQIDRQLEARINEIKIEIVKVDSKLSQEINKVESRVTQEIAKIKVDTTWIKWLFGGLLSFILILLSILITLLFKLVEGR
ncbi:MAG: hypothetical protein ACRC80_35950 [Waterburya sp.]